MQVKETYVQKMGSEYPLFCSFPRIHITHSTLFVDDISMSRTGMTSQMTQTVDEVSESVHQLVNNSNQRQPQQQNSLMLLRRQFPVLRSLARCVDMNWLAILVCFLFNCCLCSGVSCKYVDSTCREMKLCCIFFSLFFTILQKVIFFNNWHFVHGQISWHFTMAYISRLVQLVVAKQVQYICYLSCWGRNFEYYPSTLQ